MGEAFAKHQCRLSRFLCSIQNSRARTGSMYKPYLFKGIPLDHSVFPITNWSYFEASPVLNKEYHASSAAPLYKASVLKIS